MMTFMMSTNALPHNFIVDNVTHIIKICHIQQTKRLWLLLLPTGCRANEADGAIVTFSAGL